MNRDATSDRERLRAIHQSAQAGQLARAAELADAALSEGLEHPLVFNVLALRHELAGQLREAERLLRRAVALSPGDIPARNALGLCLLRLERNAEALEQFDVLVAADPSLPFVHSGRGTALLALTRAREAEAAFRRAIELDAQQPVALAGLARIASYRGLYAPARTWAERALARLPGYPDALLSLAAVDLGEHNPSAAEARLRGLLAQTDLPHDLRAFGSGLLGDVLDAQERIPEAFAAYTESNELRREMNAAQFASPAVSALNYARALGEYLRGADPALWRAPQPTPATPAAGHIFILGFPRSGTTLLDVILEGHPRAVGVEESELLSESMQRFARPGDLDALVRAPESELNTLRAAYWRRAEQAGAKVAGKVFLDKNPLNTLKLPLIARLFPRAKVLFACRDPRDIALSCFRHRFRMSAPIYELLTLEGTARYYDAVMRVLMACTRLLPLDICPVRHEDVVTGFASEMRSVCEFLGLAWDPAMEDFAPRTRDREALTPSTAQLAKGLNTQGVGHWLRYRTQLQPVLTQLAPWVKQFRYDQPPGSGGLSPESKAKMIKSPDL